MASLFFYRIGHMGIYIFVVDAITGRIPIENGKKCQYPDVCIGYGTFDLLVQIIYWNATKLEPEQVRDMLTSPKEYPDLLLLEKTGREGKGCWSTQECQNILSLVAKALECYPILDQAAQQHFMDMNLDRFDVLGPIQECDSEEDASNECSPSILQMPPWFEWQNTRRSGDWDDLAQDFKQLLELATKKEYNMFLG